MNQRPIASLLGSAAGIVTMKAVEAASDPVTRERAPKPTDVFLTERSISPLGPQHRDGERASDAAVRIAYQKLVGSSPDPQTSRRLGRALRIGSSLVAALACAHWMGRHRRAARDGALFGLGMWLVVDELALPMLGLNDRPAAYHPTQHLQTLVERVGLGVATALTTRLLEEVR